MADDFGTLADPTDGEPLGLQVAELSNALVGLYKKLFGRGPTKAHVAFATDDLLICTLENSLTPAARNLLAMGEHQRLRETWMFFQQAGEQAFVAAVERIMRRKVRAVVSGIDTHHAVSSEVFYLEPVGR